MKIKAEHYENLKTAIDSIDKGLLQDHKALGLGHDPAKRFRWDTFYAVPAPVRGPLMAELYAYLNDAHIDTALKSIIKELDL